MTGQLALLEVSLETNTEAPRCRMCARPARWLNTKQQWAMYCNGGSCNNRERICQSCGGAFAMGSVGAGTKYCSGECKLTGYRGPTVSRPACAWCDRIAPGPWRGGTWPYVCRECLSPIKHVVDRLKSHHVPHERARRLLEDPGCEVCGTNLLAKVRERSHGQPKVLLVVDHDHDCCPVSSHSCGRCIRGLICRSCNAAAGLLADEPDRARALGSYLDRWLIQREAS